MTCSPKLSDLTAAESLDALRSAIADVAERSFFAAADAWLPGADEPDDDGDAWLAATVRFEEGGCAGVVSCLLPFRLARDLFDAFNGRDPADPAPPLDDVFDLVGEFANMTCGAWLTRTATGPAFALGRPTVEVSARHAAFAARTGARVLMQINDRPIAVVVARA